MTVGLVIVSHSARIAEGTVELARQMAADVALAAAGGTDEGGIGTSFELVQASIGEADSGDGVVVLCDLGSAILTAETALEFLDDDVRDRVRIADAPIVEGAVAASVAAQVGTDLAGVLAAAESAAGKSENDSVSTDSSGTGGASATATEASASVALINPQGLHARPAAEFVKRASGFDAAITINGADAKSLLRIMALGLDKGDTAELTATGPDAASAVADLRDLIGSGFGEM